MANKTKNAREQITVVAMNVGSVFNSVMKWKHLSDRDLLYTQNPYFNTRENVLKLMNILFANLVNVCCIWLIWTHCTGMEQRPRDCIYIDKGVWRI